MAQCFEWFKGKDDTFNFTVPEGEGQIGSLSARQGMVLVFGFVVWKEECVCEEV